MYRTAGLTVLVLLMAVLFPVHAICGPETGNPECCPCPEGKKAPPPNMKDAPEEITLEKMGEFYEAVEFAHSDHTDYAEEGCAECHHHQPAGEPNKSCGFCHKRELFPSADKMNIPGLKGAYHRQCVGCHVSYGSGPTECTDCHELKTPEPAGE